MRTAPSLEAKIVDSEPEGSEIKILGEENEWFQVEYQGETAYMAAEYIEVKDLEHTALTLEAYQQKCEEERAAQGKNS